MSKSTAVSPEPDDNKQESRLVDGIDPNSLMLPADASDEVQVKAVLANIRVDRPPQDAFFRVHRKLQTRLGIIRDGESRESYCVAPALHADLAKDPAMRIWHCAVAITKQNGLYLWHLTTRDPDLNSWTATGWEGMRRAQEKWVRLVSDRQNGCYTILEAESDLGEPKWPTEDMAEIIAVAFRGRVISDINHSKLLELRGQA